nr:hypothetical protein [Pandoravirus aubagnensis]
MAFLSCSRMAAPGRLWCAPFFSCCCPPIVCAGKAANRPTTPPSFYVHALAAAPRGNLARRQTYFFNPFVRFFFPFRVARKQAHTAKRALQGNDNTTAVAALSCFSFFETFCQ